MKKNILYIIFVLLTYNVKINAQVGINSSYPKSTLDVVNSEQSNPSNNSGIIIPRVKSLNMTDSKEVGLMVFFDSIDINDRGFYWWNGIEWVPFISNSKITNNKTLTYVEAKSNFEEGNMTEALTTNNRTLAFETLKTNDDGNFEINSVGELIVKKEGYYHIHAASFIKKNSGNTNRRDQLDMRIRINDLDASQDNSLNYNLEGTNSYPVGFYSIAINAAGVLKLKANDRISMKIIRSYADVDEVGNLVILPDPNAKSNLTLRFLGNF